MTHDDNASQPDELRNEILEERLEELKLSRGGRKLVDIQISKPEDDVWRVAAEYKARDRHRGRNRTATRTVMEDFDSCTDALQFLMDLAYVNEDMVGGSDAVAVRRGRQWRAWDIPDRTPFDLRGASVYWKREETAWMLELVYRTEALGLMHVMTDIPCGDALAGLRILRETAVRAGAYRDLKRFERFWVAPLRAIYEAGEGRYDQVAADIALPPGAPERFSALVQPVPADDGLEAAAGLGEFPRFSEAEIRSEQMRSANALVVAYDFSYGDRRWVCTISEMAGNAAYDAGMEAAPQPLNYARPEQPDLDALVEQIESYCATRIQNGRRKKKQPA